MKQNAPFTKEQFRAWVDAEIEEENNKALVTNTHALWKVLYDACGGIGDKVEKYGREYCIGDKELTDLCREHNIIVV